MFTVPVYIVQNPFFINWGVRIPVHPVFSPKDSSFFFGLDIPLGEYFKIKCEAERIFWNFRKPVEWIFNCGVRVTFFDQLGIEFDLLIEPGERLSRIFKIEYHGEF